MKNKNLLFTAALIAGLAILGKRKKTSGVGKLSDKPLDLDNIRMGLERGWYTAELELHPQWGPVVYLSGQMTDGRQVKDVYPITKKDYKTLLGEGIGRTVVKPWHWTRKEDAVAEEESTLIEMPGYSVPQDYYLAVPQYGLFFKSANIDMYGEYKVKMFMDGSYIGVTDMNKRNGINELYDKGLKDEAIEYALGYRLWKETKLGGSKINPYKERARLSHSHLYYGTLDGKQGHEARQAYRRHLKNKGM